MPSNRKILIDHRSFLFLFYIMVFFYALVHFILYVLGNYNVTYMINSSLLLLVFGIGLFVNVLYWLNKCKTMQKWVPTTAQVIECELVNIIDPLHAAISPWQEFYDVKITYTYSVHEKEYSSDVYNLIPRNMLFSEKEKIKTTWEQIQKEHTVVAYINPDTPSRSVIITHCNKERLNEFYAYLFVSLVLIGLSLFILVRI